MRFWIWMCIAVVVNGCGSAPTLPGGEVALRLERTVFQASTGGAASVVPLALENQGARSVWVSGCAPRLTTLVARRGAMGEWAPPDELTSPCDGFQEVPPGSIVRFDIPVPAPGEHRISVWLRDANGRQSELVHSPPILVLGVGATKATAG